MSGQEQGQEQGRIESKRSRCECTYLHGNGTTALARQAFGLYGSTSTSVLREWPPSPPSPPRERKMGQEVVGIAHCCFRRLRGYNGTLDEVSQAGTTGTHVAAAARQVSTVDRVEWKMKSRDGLNCCHTITHTHTQTSYIHTHMQYLTRACHHH